MLDVSTTVTTIGGNAVAASGKDAAGQGSSVSS